MLDSILMMGAVPLGAVGRAAAPARKFLPAKGGTRMKKTILSLFCVLALCLGLLPTTALAAETNTVYVGGVALAGSSDSIVYATTNENGEVITEGATADNYNIKWDGSMLTLHNATIQKELNDSSLFISGSAIGVINQNGNAELTIQLEGSNTIEETDLGLSMGIYVYSSGGGAALNIKGNGTLVLNSNYQTIQVISSNGNAALSIENAKVTATSSYGFGVTVRSGSSETSSASLTVDGGSLTATAQSSGVSGIRLLFGTGGTSDGTPTVTVSNNAIVRANGSAGGITSNSSTGIQTAAGTSGESGGIVWNGAEGTVYGDVTLQDNLTVGADETLTIGKDASLTVPDGKTITVEGGGKLNGTPTGNGSVVYKVTGVTLNTDKLPLYTGDSKTLTATVKPGTATNPNVNWSSDKPEIAKVENGVVTAVAPGTATITATAADGSGQKATCTVTVTDKTYTISVTPDKLDFGTILQNAAQPAAQTVKVTNTGNQTVTLNQPAATNFLVGTLSKTELKSNETATFTVQPKAGLAVGQYAEPLTISNTNGQKATVTATLTVDPVPVTGVTLDKNTLALFTGDSAALAATVAPADATNKTVNWASSNPAIATVDDNGNVKAVAAGTANITATTADGNKTAVCAVTVTGRTYTLSSDPAAIGFGTVNTGYTQPAPQVVVIKNTGNQALNLTQPTATNYGVGALSKTALNPGETATFIVHPKAGLGAGSYNETLTISGDGGAKATVNLTFSVQAPATTATPAPTPLETHVLHFDTNGGLPLADVKFGLGAPVELWPYTPVRAGYLFQGWYSDQALTKSVATIVLTKDTTVYAKWAVDPAATAAQSGSTGSGSGSGSSSGNKGGSGTTITVTPAPTASPTPTPEPTVTPTPEPTATPEVTPAPEETDKGSFPVVPVAVGVIVLVVVIGGIVIFRRFRD